MVEKTVILSDPLPRLKWMGVQRFVAGDHSSAHDFFARARKLVLLRQQEQGSATSREGASDNDGNGHSFDCKGGASRGRITNTPTKNSVEGTRHDAEIAAGEFNPDAMRLDRCMAASICRQGPAAF